MCHAGPHTPAGQTTNNTQKSKFLLSQAFKWKKIMFFVIPEMPSKTFVIVKKKKKNFLITLTRTCLHSWMTGRMSRAWSRTGPVGTIVETFFYTVGHTVRCIPWFLYKMVNHKIPTQARMIATIQEVYSSVSILLLNKLTWTSLNRVRWCLKV